MTSAEPEPTDEQRTPRIVREVCVCGRLSIDHTDANAHWCPGYQPAPGSPGYQAPMPSAALNVEQVRLWIANHAPVWTERVGAEEEGEVVGLSDAAFVAAQLFARALAAAVAAEREKYLRVAEQLETDATGRGHPASGTYDRGVQIAQTNSALRIREVSR